MIETSETSSKPPVRPIAVRHNIPFTPSHGVRWTIGGSYRNRRFIFESVTAFRTTIMAPAHVIAAVLAMSHRIFAWSKPNVDHQQQQKR